MSENGYIGRCIGNYRIVAPVGSGGFGSVYRGVHTILTERTVAIKLLHTYLASQDECERFLQEARLLEHLHHPHILRVLDVGIDDRVPYLVAEFAPNGSLRDLIKKYAPGVLPIDTALSIILQVGEALAYAHQQNIVHRDLKPENILFDARGVALLADFGIATELTTSSIKQVTVTGTPSYMAPEQFQGAMSKESDQYALACIAYELVTGRAPFTAPDFFALGFKHMSEQPLAPTRFNPALPAAMEAAILKAMSKQRGERYADIGAFLAALQGHDISSDATTITAFHQQQSSPQSAFIPTLPNSQAPASQAIAQASSPEQYWHNTPHLGQQGVQDTPVPTRPGPVTPLPPPPISQYPGGDYLSTRLSPYAAFGQGRSTGSGLQDHSAPVPTQAAGVPPIDEWRSWKETGQALPLTGGVWDGTPTYAARRRGFGRQNMIAAIVGGVVALAIVASLLFAFLPPRISRVMVYTTPTVVYATVKPSGSPATHHKQTVGVTGNTTATAITTSQQNPTPVSQQTPTPTVPGVTPTRPVIGPTPSPTHPPVTETFRVYFDQATPNGIGVSTQNTYSGTVSIIVSGYGQASQTEYSDAFYIYTDTAGTPTPPRTQTCWVLFINGKTADASVGLPQYNASHIYNVTMSLSQPGTINFGICDGYSADNTGYLTVTVQQE